MGDKRDVTDPLQKVEKASIYPSIYNPRLKLTLSYSLMTY